MNDSNTKLLICLSVLLIVTAGAIFWSYHSPYLLSTQHLQDLITRLIELERNHPVLTPFLFMCAYILYALLSIPGLFVLSIIAGCIFIQPLCTIYVTCAATIGASLLFLIAHTTFGKFLYSKNNRFLKTMEKGFQRNAVWYLLFLRLVPLSPFWIINISGAFFRVPFWTFVWTTFLGMIPSVIIFTEAGKELGSLLYGSPILSPTSVFNPYLLATLGTTALLVLIPVFWNRHPAN